MKNNLIVLLYGMPASGKYTMAKRLQKKGALLLDNHYFHDFVKPFIEVPDEEIEDYFDSISKMKMEFFDILRKFYPKTKAVTYVFTSVIIEDEGGRKEIESIIDLAADINAEFVPIELICNAETLKARCQTEYRKERGKISNPEKIDKLLKKYKLIKLEHPNKLSIDVSDLDEDKTFQKIKEFLVKFNKEANQ